MKGSDDLPDMFTEYYRLRHRNQALLAWLMGDFFEFYFDDAEWVASILGIALSARGKRPNGEPIPMCAVPADRRFTVVENCLLVPLVPTDHYFGKIVGAGQALAVVLPAPDPRAYPWERRIVAVFHPGDFPRPAVGGVITLVGPMPITASVNAQ